MNITKISSHILWDFLLFYSVTCNFVPIFLSVFLLVSIRIVLFDPYLKGFLLLSYCWLLNPLNLHLVYVSVHLDIQYENTYQLENYRRLVDILMCLVMRDPEHQTKHNYQSKWEKQPKWNRGEYSWLFKDTTDRNHPHTCTRTSHTCTRTCMKK